MAKFTPRYYQSEANTAVWEFLRTRPGNPIVVLPTGAGKGPLSAMMVQQALAYNAQVLVLQHRKELVEQNSEKLSLMMPDADIGVYSAGLKRRQLENTVVYAGVQSVFKKANDLGRRELVIIDEAHMVNSRNTESMFGRLLKELGELNPNMRVVGMSATPYRTGEGPICGPDKIFQRICFESQTGDLIREGFLCPITNKAAEATVDTSDIAVRGGEFVESAVIKAFDTDDNVGSACDEIVTKCYGRKSILIFASGVHHAESIGQTIADLTGDRIGLITGDTLPIVRSQLIADFRSQKLRWLVNCDVLTTGFDAPCVDAIAVMRATMSPGLFAQIVGRGLRIHAAKSDCLILDFGENIKRHGSLDDPNYGRAEVATRSGRKGDPVENNGRGKECFNCGLDVAPNARECPECGFQFPVNHGSTADEDSALTGMPDPEEWLVESVMFNLHQKRSDPEAPPTLRVDYSCQPLNGGRGNLTEKKVSEWVCFEHEGFAKQKALLWWQTRSLSEPPETIEAAITMLHQNVARMSSRITTQKDGQWDRITACEFDDEIPEESEWSEFVADHWTDDAVPF